jgi:hypothetical protein
MPADEDHEETSNGEYRGQKCVHQEYVSFFYDYSDKSRFSVEFSNERRLSFPACALFSFLIRRW